MGYQRPTPRRVTAAGLAADPVRRREAQAQLLALRTVGQVAVAADWDGHPLEGPGTNRFGFRSSASGVEVPDFDRSGARLCLEILGEETSRQGGWVGHPADEHALAPFYTRGHRREGGPR